MFKKTIIHFYINLNYFKSYYYFLFLTNFPLHLKPFKLK